MVVFEWTKAFPSEERFGITDQFRRASRSVAANTAEAWRKRRCKAHFVAKLSDAEAEAAEAQVWAGIAHRCRYFSEQQYNDRYDRYDKIISQLTIMITNPDKWSLRP